MRCGTGWIAAPNKHQFAVYQCLRCGSESSTNGQQNRFLGGVTTDSPFQTTGTQTVPETAIGDSTIDESKRSSIAIWQNTLRPILSDNVTPTRSNLRNRLIPGDAFIATTALLADSMQRVQ